MKTRIEELKKDIAHFEAVASGKKKLDKDAAWIMTIHGDTVEQAAKETAARLRDELAKLQNS